VRYLLLSSAREDIAGLIKMCKSNTSSPPKYTVSDAYPRPWESKKTFLSFCPNTRLSLQEMVTLRRVQAMIFHQQGKQTLNEKGSNTVSSLKRPYWILIRW
jgi:hypothetical protein